MKKLIINTATDELFIVLQKDDEIFSASINAKMHHNETMLPAIDELLNKHGVGVNEIEELGVVVGPGSFTGIRVGISTVKAFRDALNIKAKGINCLQYLYVASVTRNPEIETVAIAGSRDSYFVAKLIHGELYIYERNLTLNELKSVAGDKPIGMFKEDENLNCFVVPQDEEVLASCLTQSEDESLVPVYYQLSQAEHERIKRKIIEIAWANIGDLDEICEIEKSSIMVNTLTKEQLERYLIDENYHAFKAVVEGEIAGFIALQLTDEVNVDSVAVKKEFRNMGIATKLLEATEQYAKERNYRALSLEVGYKNITAFLLYEKFGFKQRRIRKNYYADGTDCIEMIKEM